MKSWPWDARKVGMGDNGFPLYDRSYNAQELRDVFARFFANGIFTDTSNALQVLENNGMTVVVKPGDCIIKGSYGWEENDRELEFTAAGAKDRIDTVVLRWDNSVEQRKIDLYVVSGTPADVPTRPELTRNNVVYELGIADVFIPKNTTSITASRITDTRLESARCGVAMPFAQVNTSSFNEILTSMMNELRSQTQTAIELAQNALDETEAGYLQNQITNLGNELDDTNNELDAASTRIEEIEAYLKDIYEGRDLTEIFADEIAEAGGSWVQWIKGRIADGDFSGLRIGDYFPVTLTDGTYMPYAIGRFDGLYKNGWSLENYHTIDFVPLFAYPTPVKWNLTDTNNGTASQEYPYLASNLHNWEINTYLPKLPTELQDAITDRTISLEKRYQAGQTLSTGSGVGVVNMGKIWSLSEVEVLGFRNNGASSYSVGADSKFPIFSQTKDRPRRTPAGGIAYYWLRTVVDGNTVQVSIIDNNGTATRFKTSGEPINPLPCFRL